ncbi:MAG: hypothetical protein L3J77_04925, partial [Thermoplasmata archaeon]|nr:hypothetical protein [Thermoplasmata archaeon]
DVARSVQQELEMLGFYSGRLTATWDAATAKAFEKFLGENNFENKARTDGMAWPSVLQYLDERARAESTRRTSTAPIVSNALDRGPGGAPKSPHPSHAPAEPAGAAPSPTKPEPKGKARRSK